MKRLVLIAFSVSLIVIGYFCYPVILSSVFTVSGTIDITPRLSKMSEKPNNVCFIVAKNPGGVPVVIKRVVNPEFPLDFNITKKDLLIEDAWKDTMQVEVFINQHGQVGRLKAGDMFTEPYQIAKIFSPNVVITVDKMMGVPTLIGRRYSDKSNWVFTTAAR